MSIKHNLVVIIVVEVGQWCWIRDGWGGTYVDGGRGGDSLGLS